MGEVAPEAAVAIFGEGFQAPDEQGEEGENGELPGDAVNAELGDEGVFFVDDDVDGDADEVRGSEVEDGVENGADKGTPNLNLVGFAVAKKTQERKTTHIKRSSTIKFRSEQL